jgi:hypothetical protein
MNDINLVKSPVSEGIGMLGVSLEKPIPLYRTENDTIAIDVLSFKRDREGVLHFNTKYLKSLNPYQLSGGETRKQSEKTAKILGVRLSPSLVFRVLEESDNFYRVVLDEHSFETVVIHKTRNTSHTYTPWDELNGKEIIELH